MTDDERLARAPRHDGLSNVDIARIVQNPAVVDGVPADRAFGDRAKQPLVQGEEVGRGLRIDLEAHAIVVQQVGPGADVGDAWHDNRRPSIRDTARFRRRTRRHTRTAERMWASPGRTATEN